MKTLDPNDMLESKFLEANSYYEAGDFQKAFEGFTQLSDIGDMSSLNNLAVMYEAGEGVTKNLTKAIELYTLGWEQTGWTGFALNLANLYLCNQAEDLAVIWWQKTISVGDGTGKFELAKYLLDTNSRDTNTIRHLLQEVLESDSVCLADQEMAEILLQKLSGSLDVD